MAHDSAVTAINFALSRKCEEPMEFLRCWNEGDFDAIRRGWPEAPEHVFPDANLFRQNGSPSLLDELVREALKIAMFDMPYDDDSVPEVKSAKSEFRAAFKRVLGGRR